MTRLLAFIALAACSSSNPEPIPDAAMPDAMGPDVVVHVVRHAETGSTATDPPLDATGQARAQTLATLLAPENVTLVLASQFHRTRDTGMPTAAAAGIAITVVEITSSNGLTYGNELLDAVHDSMSTSVLIVGHSNTVPATVKAFTGTAVPPIDDTEFDLIYTITFAADGIHLVEATY